MEYPFWGLRENEKMLYAAKSITLWTLYNFPGDYVEGVVGGILDMADIVRMAMINAIRDVFEQVSEKKSLRYHLNHKGIDYDDKSTVMRYSRHMKFIMEQRKLEYERLAETHGITPEMADLIPPDMNDIKNKKDGYKLNDMQFFEINNIMENEFTKALTENRLTNSKKISNDRFKDIMGQYDAIIENLNSEWDKNDHTAVFNTIAAFVLEWKFPVHFLYSIAKRMEELGISEFCDEQSRIGILTANINVESIYWGNHFSVPSRMVTVRDRYIDIILKEPAESDYYMDEYIRYCEALNLICQIRQNTDVIDGMSVKDWFLKNTEEEDWASFCRDYNIFETINPEKKEWTDKRIRYFRKLYDKILIKPEGGGVNA